MRGRRIKTHLVKHKLHKSNEFSLEYSPNFMNYTFGFFNNVAMVLQTKYDQE